MDLSLFYFADAPADPAGGDTRYRLLIEGAKFADRHGFSAIWTGFCLLVRRLLKASARTRWRGVWSAYPVNFSCAAIAAPTMPALLSS